MFNSMTSGPLRGESPGELLLTALSGATRHVSLVTGAGAALPRAVADVPVRRRRTRLVALLREGL